MLNRPIRQDYLDKLVWDHVVRLLENPELIRGEIQRRIRQIQNTNRLELVVIDVCVGSLVPSVFGYIFFYITLLRAGR